MTYNVFGGMLNRAQSINLVFKAAVTFVVSLSPSILVWQLTPCSCTITIQQMTKVSHCCRTYCCSINTVIVKDHCYQPCCGRGVVMRLVASLCLFVKLQLSPTVRVKKVSSPPTPKNFAILWLWLSIFPWNFANLLLVYIVINEIELLKFEGSY